MTIVCKDRTLDRDVVAINEGMACHVALGGVIVSERLQVVPVSFEVTRA